MSRNEYAGTCYRCGKRVEAGECHYERVSKSQVKKWSTPISVKWLVQHVECAIKYRGTDQHYQYAPTTPLTARLQDNE